MGSAYPGSGIGTVASGTAAAAIASGRMLFSEAPTKEPPATIEIAQQVNRTFQGMEGM
jgi:hypothetical protein